MNQRSLPLSQNKVITTLLSNAFLLGSIALALSLVRCIGWAASRDTKLTTDEEYIIYSVVVGATCAQDPNCFIALEDQTASINSFVRNWDKTVVLIKRKMPNLRQDTLNDFYSKNGNPCALKAAFKLKVEYVFISKKESEVIYKGGWREFYLRYPKARCLWKLSRVGFSRDMKQALVYVKRQSGYNSGQGVFYLLEKKGCEWIVASEYLYSVS
jgi:hypothetical protein